MSLKEKYFPTNEFLAQVAEKEDIRLWVMDGEVVVDNLLYVTNVSCLSCQYNLAERGQSTCPGFGGSLYQIKLYSNKNIKCVLNCQMVVGGCQDVGRFVDALNELHGFTEWRNDSEYYTGALSFGYDKV